MKKITVAVTLDERMGIAFNKRRQSRDRIQINDLVDTIVGKIYVSKYSLPLFEEYKDRIVVADDPLRECPDGGCCFVEKTKIGEHLDDVETFIVYRWNRHYPSDVKLDVDFSGYKMVDCTEFVGSSHEKITKETYIKCK